MKLFQLKSENPLSLVDLHFTKKNLYECIFNRTKIKVKRVTKNYKIDFKQPQH